MGFSGAAMQVALHFHKTCAAADWFAAENKASGFWLKPQ